MRSNTQLLVLVGASVVAVALTVHPAAARAQSSPDDIYSPMPAPQYPQYSQPAQPGAQPGQPYGQPAYPQYGQPGQYGQYGAPQAVPPPDAQPPVDDNLPPYADAGAEAYARTQAEQDGSYVDDGYDVDAYVDYQGALSPYGNWVSTADYGQVWAPSESVVGAGFTPYGTGGHFVLTEYGWTWVSDWSWGWAPFHYGRWLTIGNYGWCWIPGRVWGPAWVGWRSGGGYVGWAPLPPRGAYVPPPPGIGRPGGWHFATAASFAAGHPALVAGEHAHAIWAGTQALRNVQSVGGFKVEAGPHPAVIAAASGRALQPTPVHAISVAAPRSTIVPHAAPAFASPGMRTGSFGPGTGVSPGYRAPMNTAPAYRSSSPFPGPSSGYHGMPAPSVPQYRAAAPAYAPPAYRPSYALPSYSAPAYRSAPSYSPPAWHAAPSYAPSYSAPIYHSAPSYSAPSYHAAPSYSAPSAPSYHAPSFSAPSGGGFRGGGGGFRGGGRR